MRSLQLDLLPDWRRVLRQAWSIRFSILATVFTAAEVVVPALAASIGATISRLLAQPEMHR